MFDLISFSMIRVRSFLDIAVIFVYLKQKVCLPTGTPGFPKKYQKRPPPQLSFRHYYFFIMPLLEWFIPQLQFP